MKIKPKTRSLLPIAMGTALVLVTYVTPIATLSATAAGLGAGTGARAWVLSSMSVGLAAGLLAAGVIGDNLGRRRVYLAGLVALALGGLCCFGAWEPVGFVAGRLIEGLGGAAVLACGLAILANDHREARSRTHATAVWGTSVGGGITIGMLLSAVFGAATWRQPYLSVAVVALILLWPSISRIGESRAVERRRLDGLGLVLFAAAMVLLVCALTLGRNGIRALPVALGAAGVLALVAFAFAEVRVRDPLVELKLLRHPRFRAATVGSLTLGAGIIATVSFAPTLAQVGLGSGLWPASLLVVAWSGTSVATGLLNALLGREAVASVEADRAAMGSGANNTARYFGAAVGITLFVVIATHAGTNLAAGWNVAVLTSAAITLAGAGVVAVAGRARADNVS